jgi:hypothetical protein
MQLAKSNYAPGSPETVGTIFCGFIALTKDIYLKPALVEGAPLQTCSATRISIRISPTTQQRTSGLMKRT